MATEILVNDGGAPCRIIPMVVTVANVSAGDALSANHAASADATCQPLDSDLAEKNYLGVALTDANIGEICNVITGRGVVVRINCADVNGGVAMMAGTSAGQLTTFADSADLFAHPVAITMEHAGAAGLTKCLTL